MSSDSGGGSLIGDLIWLIVVVLIFLFVWYRYGGHAYYERYKARGNSLIHIPTFDEVEQNSPKFR